ncbi:MAG: DUF5132 domain-containing protein [Rhodoplanes sp.]
MSPFSSLAAGALGAVVGGLAVALFGPQLAKSGRPVAKSALKTALLTLYAAQVRGAEIAEAIEDLYAEAKSEVAADVLEAALAAMQETARFDLAENLAGLMSAQLVAGLIPAQVPAF